jgi:hypothetical protein
LSKINNPELVKAFSLINHDGIHRNLDYVVEECEQLIDQIDEFNEI